MSHNTVFGGASREIEGGTALIGGVAREIESGLVLVNGVSREVDFGGDVCVVTINSVGYHENNSTVKIVANVKIGGITYDSDATIEVPIGTVMTCYAYGLSKISAPGKLTVNGVNTAEGYPLNYNYTLTTSAAIELAASRVQNYGYYGTVAITTS